MKQEARRALDWRDVERVFVTSWSGPCPYLPGQTERKLLTQLGTLDSQSYDELSAAGFRRSHDLAYRPACINCNACVSVRLRAAELKLSRSHKRCLKMNKDLTRGLMRPRDAAESHYDLFRDYVRARHTDGSMADMNQREFQDMLEGAPIPSYLVEWHYPNRELAAACLIDLMSDGISAVYSFFDTEQPKRSLGKFMILDLAAIAIALGVPYVYLGYWVKGSHKMDYKAAFAPLEGYRQGRWIDMEDRSPT